MSLTALMVHKSKMLQGAKGGLINPANGFPKLGMTKTPLITLLKPYRFQRTNPAYQHRRHNEHQSTGYYGSQIQPKHIF